MDSVPVSLDLLLEEYGDVAQEEVLRYDEENDVVFQVSEVMSVDEHGPTRIAMIRFMGYPKDFDMPFNMSQDDPHPGFAEAYVAFTEKQRPLTPPRMAPAAVLPEASVQSDVLGHSDDFELEPMNCNGKDKEEASAGDFLPSIAEPGAGVAHEGASDDAGAPAPNLPAAGGPDGNDAAVQLDSRKRVGRRGAVSKTAKPKQTRKAKAKKRSVRESSSSDSGNDSGSLEVVMQPEGTSASKRMTKKQFLRLEQAQASQLKTKGARASLLFWQLDDDKYRCRLCNEEKKSSLNLSNLVTHLTSRHEEFWKAVNAEHEKKKSVVDFIKSYLDAHGKVGAKPLTQRKLDQWLDDSGTVHNLAKAKLSLLIWGIKCHIAFNAFEAKEFRAFADHAGIAFDSAHEMKEKTTVLYHSIVGLVEGRLALCPSVCVTADMWTSISDGHYLVLTYHGINPETFEVVHHVLDLQVSYASTGNVIATLVEKHIARHLGDRKKVVALVVDSGSNMLKAGQMLETPIQKCFAHAIKRMMDIVLGKAPRPKAKYKELFDARAALDLQSVKAIAELLRTNNFMKKQVLGDDEDTLELILENATRWEGRYLALERFVRLKSQLKHSESLRKYFELVEHKRDLAADLLEKSFFQRLEGHCELLKVFHEVSVLSQYEKQCSIAWIALWIRKIEKACMASGSSLGHSLKRAVEVRLVPKYLSVESLALKAALLNPGVFPIVSKIVSDESVIKDAWTAIVEEVGNASAEGHDPESVEERKNILAAMRPALQRSMVKWYNDRRAAAKQKNEGKIQISNSDIFGFWKSCDVHTVAFVPVACRYLGIPATSAPAERAFSSAGLMATKLRNRIGHDLLEKLVVCRDWIQQDCYSLEDTVKHIEESFRDTRSGASNADKDAMDLSE